MPHASAANFTPGTDKAAAWESLLASTASLVSDQRNWVCNTANAASLLWHMFHALSGPSLAVNWAGFYVLDPKVSGQLVLGPFMGKVACQTIRVGRGVCGVAAEQGRTLRVSDVEAFPGHIACDGDSRSEIVVPIMLDGRCVGVIDVDCMELDGFDEVDQKGVEALADLLAKSCDW